MGTNRIGQEDFKTRVKFRDNNQCVFCDFGGDPLYAAHILPYANFKSDCAAFETYEISGINSTSNGLTLCWNCHQAFDNNLVCISPVEYILLVVDALLSFEPEKWGKLNKKTILFARSIDIPREAVLRYRYNEMNTKTVE